MRKTMLAVLIGIIALGAYSGAAFGHKKHHGFKSDDFAQQDVCVDMTPQTGATPGDEEASAWLWGKCNSVQLHIGFVTRQVYVVPQD